MSLTPFSKKMVCIECPNGCELSVMLKGKKLVHISGNKCEKGETYAYAEVEHPVRILTSTVLTKGMPVKMLPVRTDKPIPKKYMFKAMKEIKKIRIKKPIRAGDIIVRGFLGLKLNLIATRSIHKKP